MFRDHPITVGFEFPTSHKSIIINNITYRKLISYSRRNFLQQTAGVGNSTHVYQINFLQQKFLILRNLTRNFLVSEIKSTSDSPFVSLSGGDL